MLTWLRRLVAKFRPRRKIRVRTGPDEYGRDQVIYSPDEGQTWIRGPIARARSRWRARRGIPGITGMSKAEAKEIAYPTRRRSTRGRHGRPSGRR